MLEGRPLVKRIALLLPLFALAFSACNDVTTPVGPEDSTPGPFFAISDGAHAGNEHFYWLPPMLTPAPTVSGVFDGAADPTVSICAWSGSACLGDPIFTSNTALGLTVNTVDEWYGVDWFVFDQEVADGDIFRISVSASRQELGFADLMIVDKVTGQLKKTLGGEYLLLSENNGKKFLKIRFRVEEGAVVPTAEIVWTAETSGTTERLLEVWGSSSTDIYAAGDGAALLRSDGNTWALQAQSVLPPDFEFRGLSGLPGLSHDVIAGGASATSGIGIFHFNGTDWARLGGFPPTSNTHGAVRGLSEGYFGLIVGNQEDLRGKIWRATPVNTIGVEWGGADNTALVGAWGTSFDGTGFAVGADQRILHDDNDGSGWVQQHLSPGGPSLQSVWGTAVDDVFAVGEGGVILHYDGSSWSPQASGTAADLFEVSGSSSTDVYAVGRGSLVLHYDGTDWTPVDVGVLAEVFFGVWVSPDGNSVYIVGTDGVIVSGRR